MRFKKKKRKIPYVPVTSFGDIAFLLIIFFMVASVFMREAHIIVEQADSPDVDKIEGIAVSVVLDKDGELWLQGERCPKDALEPAVAVLIQNSKDKSVALKIDKNQVQKNFGYVLAALGGAGADIVMLGEKEWK